MFTALECLAFIAISPLEPLRERLTNNSSAPVINRFEIEFEKTKSQFLCLGVATVRFPTATFRFKARKY